MPRRSIRRKYFYKVYVLFGLPLVNFRILNLFVPVIVWVCASPVILTLVVSVKGRQRVAKQQERPHLSSSQWRATSQRPVGVRSTRMNTHGRLRSAFSPCKCCKCTTSLHNQLWCKSQLQSIEWNTIKFSCLSMAS